MSRCLVRGSINVDIFFHVDNVVRPGETISSTLYERRPGGKGANQAVALARAGAAGRVDMVGCIGEDPDGRWVANYLDQNGVNVDGVRTITSDVDGSEVTTGRAIIQLTPAGENSIILYKGANYASCEPKIPPNTSFLLLQNEIPFSQTLSFISEAKRSPLSVSIVFNPSPMPSQEELEVFPWKDLQWLVVNEGEALDISAAITVVEPSSSIPSNPDIPKTAVNIESALLRIHHHINSANIICTLGADGILVLAPSLLQDVIHLPAAELQGTVRDTTGAGDCFTGYLVSGLMEAGETGLDEAGLVRILQRSIQAAGMCVERRGAMESFPTAEEVNKRLAGSRQH